VAFGVALLGNKLPASAHAAVCRAYSEHMFYWGAVTLGFRLLMSLTQFLRVDYPSLLAFVRLCLALVMLVMLMYFRPYKYQVAFWVDVACYVSLIALFGLQSLAESFEFLGVVPRSNASLLDFFVSISVVRTVLR
jgi:hypothetical protein